MNCKYKLCTIRDNLEINKLRLKEMISHDVSNLLNSDVIKLSQNIDALLVKCMQCKTTRNIIDILDVNNITGKHSMFFYYGKEHLLVCLIKYITQGIEKNEYCPVFIQPDWFESLLGYLSHINSPSRNIIHYTKNAMIESFLNGGSTAFREKILEMEKWSEAEGFSGIRMIGQCSYGIQLSSKSIFLEAEKAASDCFNGTKVGALCLYDFYDYIHTSKYIEDDIVCESFKTHTNLYLQSSYKDYLIEVLRRKGQA